MIPHLFFSQLVLLGLLWLLFMLPAAWPRQGTATQPRPVEPILPPRKRSSDPKPFPGLTRTPPCAACVQAHEHGPQPPGCPPPRIVSTRGRPRQVDTSFHFCPKANCDYWGWVGLGNIRANGHPNGGPWRQRHYTNCGGSFQETHGTPLHGTRVALDVLVWAVGALAEGLGIRATARVFEVDPNTVLQWLVEAAEQFKAFSGYCLCDVHVRQLQLDELYAVLRGVKNGEISEDDAIKRLERSRHWVWTVIDPESKLLLATAIGPRTLAMAQRVVHQVTQALAPGCVPLFLTDGFTEYRTAILAHFGYWRQPERRQDKGPLSKPRWMPLPALRYAQVVKSYRHRRLVGVTHRVVFGTRLAIEQVLAACGWTINTSFVERLNLDIRQRVAAIGRRVNTLCQGEAGLRDQLALCQTYHNFVLPHASLRQPLPVPEVTNGHGSAKLWQRGRCIIE